MLPALDISTSGLVAQRMRMNALSSNIANVSTTHNEQGERIPYQPKYVVFEADETIGAHGAPGVKVSYVGTADVKPVLKFEPDHEDADENGYVAYPSVNMMVQFTDAMEAARAYEANLGAIEIAKDLEQQTLRILA